MAPFTNAAVRREARNLLPAILHDPASLNSSLNATLRQSATSEFDPAIKAACQSSKARLAWCVKNASN